jgi:arabinogalactan oligomer/maltooligosaccharide transport system permease protein
MSKKKSTAGIILLVVAGIFLLGAIFMAYNRISPLWSFRDKYMTDNFLFILIGTVCTVIGVILLVSGINAIKRANDDGTGRHIGMRAMNITVNTILYILLVLISVIWLFPFFCIVVQSFRVQPTGMTRYLFQNPEASIKEGLTIKFGFENYVRLFTQTQFPTWYLNTFVIAIIVAIVQTMIVLCMSYALSRFRFKLRKPMMQFMLVLGMFPGMLSLIILYQVLKDIGLAGTNAIPGLILVYVASSGMGYYVSKGFFDTIPKSLDEAARVDGATRAQVFFKIILPLAKPIVIYTVLTAFMGPWADFVFARYVTGVTPSAWNVAVGLQNWLSTTTLISENYTMFCTGGVVVAIPVVILFMCLQRYYVEGVTGGAVKG